MTLSEWQQRLREVQDSIKSHEDSRRRASSIIRCGCCHADGVAVVSHITKILTRTIKGIEAYARRVAARPPARRDDKRVVWIQGERGTGKTRYAHQLAWGRFGQRPYEVRVSRPRDARPHAIDGAPDTLRGAVAP